jgi:hypothetical protein
MLIYAYRGPEGRSRDCVLCHVPAEDREPSDQQLTLHIDRRIRCQRIVTCLQVHGLVYLVSNQAEKSEALCHPYLLAHLIRALP